MITVSILGLDQYVVGHYSGEVTAKLAALYETKPEAIDFYAPESFIFHDGVEQTSWNALVRVHAPAKYKPLQPQIAKFILGTLSGLVIHLAVEFYYFQEADRYEKTNPDYPRFITDSNLVKEADEALGESEEESDVYDGNIFENFEEKIVEVQTHHHEHEGHEEAAEAAPHKPAKGSGH